MREERAAQDSHASARRRGGHGARWIALIAASLAVHLAILAALAREPPPQRVAAPIPVEVAFVPPATAPPSSPSRPSPTLGAPASPVRRRAPPAGRPALRRESPRTPPTTPAARDPDVPAARAAEASAAGDRGPAGPEPVRSAVPDGIGGAMAGGRDSHDAGPDAAAGGALAFDPSSMTRPQYVSGPSPAYTRRAIERGIEGDMVVRCVIQVDGAVRRCEVVEGLPYLDEAVVEALQARLYRPAMRGDIPVEVKYSFRLHMKMPQ